MACLRVAWVTVGVLDDVDVVEGEFFAADGLGQCLLHGPSRCHELDLLALVLHLEVVPQLLLVQELADEALGVVLSQDLLDPHIHHQINPDPQYFHQYYNHHHTYLMYQNDL